MTPFMTGVAGQLAHLYNAASGLLAHTPGFAFTILIKEKL
jgi:hypothetical protein